VNPIVNLNLPIFKQKRSDEIDNFQSNFKKLKPGDQITAGTKSLKFIKISKSQYHKPTRSDMLKHKRDWEYSVGLTDKNSTMILENSPQGKTNTKIEG